MSASRLRAIAERALGALGHRHADAHVTVVDDAAIRRLNRRYLGVRRATDVLAFDLRAPGPSRLLGEVVVSAETAARQARAAGVPTALELDLLVVHGLLHLSGYDDATPRLARRMHSRAREILESRGAVPAGLWRDLLPVTTAGRV